MRTPPVKIELVEGDHVWEPDPIQVSLGVSIYTVDGDERVDVDFSIIQGNEGIFLTDENELDQLITVLTDAKASITGHILLEKERVAERDAARAVREANES